MTLLDCVGLGINGIIGTGIFLLPAKVFRNAGGFSWAAWLAIEGVCLLVGLCFCEASGRADRNGGPHLYARDAFGRRVGFSVGRGPSAFALPLTATIPVSATLGCILFLNGIHRDDAIFSLFTLALGLLLHAAWRAYQQRRRAVAEAG